MAEEKIVLIVDDDKVFQLYMNKIITKAFDLKTHIVNNPKEALDWLSDNEAVLITMDMEMPYMDGFTAIKKIRSVDSIKHIPIVACSRLANTDLVVRLIKLKIMDYIQKGSPAEVIVKKLSKSFYNAGIIDVDKYNTGTNAIKEEKRLEPLKSYKADLDDHKEEDVDNRLDIQEKDEEITLDDPTLNVEAAMDDNPKEDTPEDNSDEKKDE